MQPARYQMRAPSRHCQTLVPSQICNIFEPGIVHSQPACKRVPRVVPTKILDFRLNQRVVKPVPPILKRLPCPGILEHTPYSVALGM
ncbi:MAG: hypothetical protein WBQ89_25980 [Candidatus Acidiferrum sp.]